MASLSEYQRDILARTILGEARGEGPQGMAAVAQVILNRANSGKFPNDPAKVALQDKQFSVWNSGEGGGKTQYNKGSDEYQNALRIIDSVASGQVPDITNGALYYHTPDVSPKWSTGVNQYGTNQIGNHIFYNGRPTPPGEIPQVASMMDTARRSPVPATISPSSAAVRSMTSPTGGNSGLQSALDPYAARERNRVEPASIDDRVTARNRAWINANPATETNVASIPTARTLTQSGAINGSVNGLSQDPALAAALSRRNLFSDDPGTPANGSVVASMPTRSVPPVSRAPISYAGQDAARSLFSGDPGTPSSGRVVSSIPTSNIGQRPATRTVQSVPVPPRIPVSASANITQARNEQMATRAPAVRPTNTVPQRYAGQDRANPVNVLPNRAQLEAATPFSVPQASPFSYNPYAPVPSRLTPNVLPVDPFAAAVAPLSRQLPAIPPSTGQSQVPLPRARPNMQQPIQQQVQQPARRFAPVPFARPFGLGQPAPARPPVSQPLRIVVNGGAVVPPTRSAPLQLAGYTNDGNGKLTSTSTGGVYYERHLNR